MYSATVEILAFMKGCQEKSRQLDPELTGVEEKLRGLYLLLNQDPSVCAFIVNEPRMDPGAPGLDSIRIVTTDLTLVTDIIDDIQHKLDTSMDVQRRLRDVRGPSLVLSRMNRSVFNGCVLSENKDWHWVPTVSISWKYAALRAREEWWKELTLSAMKVCSKRNKEKKHV